MDEELVLTAAAEATSVRNALGGSVKSLNVPAAAPAEAPRLAVVSDQFLLSMGLSQYEFVLNVPSHVAASARLPRFRPLGGAEGHWVTPAPDCGLQVGRCDRERAVP